MKKVTSSAVLLILVLASVTGVAAQIRKRSQGPRAVAKSANNASTAPENKSTDSASEKIPGTNSLEAQKYYASGTDLYASGKLGAAIEAFKEAAKLRPDDPQTHYMLGMAYSKSKAYKESFDSFKRAIRFWPEWTHAHFRLGVVSYVLGRRTESLKAYNNLLRLESPLASSLSRIINEDDNQAPLGEGATGIDWSLTENDLVGAAVPVKEATNTAEGDSNQVPTNNAESKSVSASLSSTIKDSAPIASDPPAATEDTAELTSIYKIGVGDVLDIRVLNSSTTRSTLYTVIDGGLIDLAIAGGPITVAGLTTDAIQALIAAELKRRAIEEGARVSVSVRQYASHSVTIAGLVNNPGTKFLRREAVPLYVLMAEAQARLDAGRVAIMRPGSTGLTMDLSDPATLNFLIRPGDMISVTVRPQEFYYIAGRITYPGQKVFQPGITLLQAILAAGGLRRQNEDLIEVSREGRDGLLTTIRYKLKDIKAGIIHDPRLQPGDRIEVVVH